MYHAFKSIVMIFALLLSIIFLFTTILSKKQTDSKAILYFNLVGYVTIALLFLAVGIMNMRETGAVGILQIAGFLGWGANAAFCIKRIKERNNNTLGRI